VIPKVCSKCGAVQPDPTIRYFWEQGNYVLCSRCYYNIAIEIKGSPAGKSWPSNEEIFERGFKDE
jgi:hypothetical protein